MKIKLDDKFVIGFLGIGFPAFLVVITAILLVGALLDHLSFMEVIDALQGVVPVCLTYIGAILGFAFTGHAPEFMVEGRRSNSIQRLIRVYISLLFPSTLMAFHLVLTTLFVFGKLPFDDYKLATAIVMWVLTAAVGFIVGKYFGESAKLTPGQERPSITPP